MYFYLEWNDRRPDKILFLKEKPNDINFENKFKIQSIEHIICGKINPKMEQYNPPLELYYKKVPYLLSHLQKSIRRMNDIISVKTAKHLIDLDYNSFLRRLPIIMLEDVTIHSSFPIIIWLMIATTKGFPMKYEIIKWLLGIIYHLSTCRDVTFYMNKEIKEIPLNEEDEIMLHALRFRKVYGGMKGDMNMIEFYTQLLYSKNIKINEDKIPIIKIPLKRLRKKEWIIEANDFHCNHYIIDYLEKRHPKLKKDYIKLLIWNFSSSQNNRILKENDSKQENDWDKIYLDVINYQKKCRFY